MSAADDKNTAGPPPNSGVTWVQLYRGEQAVGFPMPITITEAAPLDGAWTKLVKAEYPELNDISSARLAVYPHGTPLNALNEINRLGSVPGGTTEAQPLMVIAPVVWIQLYRGDKALGFPIEIVEATRNVTHLTELVKGKRAVALHNFDAVDLAVYSPGIPWDALTDSNPLDPGGSVPGGTTKAQPLIVIAPVVWIQLYHGDTALGSPIEIVASTCDVSHLTELVKEKRAVALHNVDAADLAVYPPGTPLNALNDNNRLGSVPGGTTEAQPLMVIAPVVWIQLYRGDKAVGNPIEIVEATRNVTHLTELVKGKRPAARHNFDAADLAVYPSGTPLNALNENNRLRSVPGGTTEAQPLMVIAPVIWIQLYRGGTALGSPIDIVASTCDVSQLTKLVKAEMPNDLNTVDPSHLAVYPSGISWDALKDTNPFARSGSVPGGTTEAQPLIVIVPSLPMRPGSDMLSFALSRIGVKNKNSILMKLKMTEIGASWENRPEDLQDLPAFNWQNEQSENSEGNRLAYTNYLCNNLNLPLQDCVFDVGVFNNALSAEISEDIHLRGTTDVVIADQTNGEKAFIRGHCKALIELKMPRVLGIKEFCPQAVCELVAGSFVNKKYGVVAVLTDLASLWTFFWFALTNSDSVGIYCLFLEGDKAAREAKYILESLDNNSCADTLPTTFTKRLSWDAMSNREAKDLKRARSDDGSVGGSHETMTAQPPTGGGHPTRSQYTDRWSSTSMESIMEGDVEGGEQMSDSVAFLCQLAPHYRSSDVGNILDLLDMVDEEEKHNLVRSFAWSDIVPYIIKGG